MAKIQLNGKKVTIKNNVSIFDLLKKHKLLNKKVAVEHNGTIVAKEIFTYNTATTVSGTDYHYMVQDCNRKGNPLWFHSGADLYLRSPDDGSTYGMTNYVTSGGGASATANNYGMTANDNILWATN